MSISVILLVVIFLWGFSNYLGKKKEISRGKLAPKTCLFLEDGDTLYLARLERHFALRELSTKSDVEFIHTLRLIGPIKGSNRGKTPGFGHS